MKTRRFLWVLFMAVFFMVLCSLLSFGQPNQAEVPGDDFSLEGALEVFKKSTSPEDFERQLNSADSKVNNLDLNGDGDIDYIRVIDRNEGNVHAFILQTVISERESQDVAVIELEKLANGKAVLQITGDEDVYGMETIIEPTTEVRVNAGTTTTRTMVNVWAWPSVQYVYSPYYIGWVSPYRWSMRPTWWRPWRPVAYYTYNPWWQPYRSYYSVCYTHRVGYAQQLYRPMRTTSFVVYSRHYDQVAHYRMRQDNDRYNNRYSDRYYGKRNDRSNNNDSGSSGAYDQRDRNDRGRSASQQGNPLTQSTETRSRQPDWKNNRGESTVNSRQTTATADQHRGIESRPTYSVERTNRTGDQRVDREVFTNQNREAFTNQPQHRMTDVQRIPDNTNRMSRTSMPSPSINRESMMHHRQTTTPTRELRQSPSVNPGRTTQLSKPSFEHGSTGRGR